MKIKNPDRNIIVNGKRLLAGTPVVLMAGLVAAFCFVLPRLAVAQEAPKDGAAAEAPKTGVPAVSAPAKPKRPPLAFEKADLSIILPAMAKQAGISLILPEDVKGTVTARLVDLPIKQAMEVILESKGYQLIERDGVFLVKSKESINQEPTKTEIYQFANASARESKPTVEKLLSRAAGANVQLDERSNTLVITDVPSNLSKIIPILKTLDTVTPQVMIETKLLEMTRNPKEAVGVNWTSLASYTVSLASPVSAVSGTGTDNSSSGHLMMGITRSGDPGGTTTTTYRRGGVLTPIGGAASGYPFAAVLDMPAFSTTLSFLLQDNDTELLGSPKVITADNKEATIKVAEQRPIPNFTFNQQTASFVISGFEYKDIGNILKVTPRVNRDNFITLDVEPNVSSSNRDSTFTISGSTVTIPIIAMRTLTSRVMVKSGNTLAIGGLLSADSNRTFSKVPFFGDIPMFGDVFRYRSFEKNKRNLLVFITPTIVTSDGGTGLEDQYAQLKEADQNDRFAYRKSFIGNAKPRDQFNKGREPSAVPITGGLGDMKQEENGATVEEKNKALEQAASEMDQTTLVDSEQLAPRLAPGLRE
ncbi:MAG: secretin N-terminal domain-containing protein [Verrucomicrobiae bacterium]|nr:secretin N-terminal domain-containing protein [Verrucomicrobiae bacterium]